MSDHARIDPSTDRLREVAEAADDVTADWREWLRGVPKGTTVSAHLVLSIARLEDALGVLTTQDRGES